MNDDQRNHPASPSSESPATDAQFSGEAGDDATAWEEVAPGRFMPRRIKGSCQGRALG
jgi:hypothetical protein